MHSEISLLDQANIHRMAADEDSVVRQRALDFLSAAFSYFPDKTLAWQDLHRLTEDEDRHVRWRAAGVLRAAFSHVPDKALAWQDLHRLIQDEDSSVRLEAAIALREAFSHVPDESLAWQDLVRLTQDKDWDVWRRASEALVSAVNQVPDKDQAWENLICLIADRRVVRRRVSEALGLVVNQVSEKAQAWQDLVRLTEDEDSIVRMHAYHSLGRASIFRAIEAKDNEGLNRELAAAVAYFEKSSHESEFSPARFCHPFYRSYLAITFQESKEDEVQKYLAEAKSAVGSSKSKDELLEAVENLGMALRESQRLNSRSVEEVVSELNAYRWYCDKAAEHMAAAEDGAPSAVKLMRMCNPILEERIQAAIFKIQEKAKQICEITRGSGTVYEAPGNELQKAAKALSTGDLSSIQKNSPRIVWQLKKFCRLLPAEDKKQFCGILEEIEHEPEFPEMLNGIVTALLCLGPVLADKSPPLADVVILTILSEEYGSIRDRLSELGPPPNMGSLPNLYAWKFGKVSCQSLKADYKIAVGMIGRAGTTEGALAAREAVQLWRPRYVIFCGIAGGLPDPKERNSHPRLGDVVVADIIYGYEYGKLERKFKPRSNWTYRADQALLTGSMAYSLSDGWRKLINAEPPRECMPHVIMGEIASGDKVVDNPSNGFFAKVLKKWPRINAVEMEGAGAAAAIEQAGSQGIPTRFMMIRGISDLPRAKGKNKGRKERDAWKAYASDAAAAFVMGWIGDGLPLPPFARREDL